MSDVSSLRDTIVPKSDQLNSEQLLSGPMTITVTEVRRGDSKEQPVCIYYDGCDERPYKPCLTMRKALIFAWGDDGREWVGKSMTLFNDPEVKWGGVKVGGIRISHMTTDKDMVLSLTTTRGKKTTITIRKLQEPSKPATKPVAQVDRSGEEFEAAMASLMASASLGMEELKSAWSGLPQATRTLISSDGKCPDAAKKAALLADAADDDNDDGDEECY